MEPGNGARNNAEDPSISNPILDLPLNVRVKLYNLFNNPTRRSLRLTSVNLRNDIDITIGPVNPLRLKRKFDTPKEILAFLKSSVFQGLEINVKAKEFIFEDTISSPMTLRTINLTENGKISSKFANSLLTSCTNLSEIIWNGVISGDLPITETPLIYRNLKKLTLGIPNLKVFWKFNMHYSILNRIHAPCLNIIQINLSTFDDNLLMETIFKFLISHPQAETVLLQLENDDLETTGIVVIPSQPIILTCEEKRIFQSFRTKRLEISMSSNSNENKEPQWVNFINNLTQVEHLTFDIFHYNDFWKSYDQNCPITLNPSNLKSLQLSGRFGNVRPMCLPAENLDNLSLLIIQNHTFEITKPPPSFQGFKPTQNMAETLEVLILTHFRFPPEIFNIIMRFKKLKHLALIGLDQFGRFDATVSFHKFVQILQIRSLETLLIPTTVSDVNEKMLYANLIPYVIPFLSEEQRRPARGRLYNIADPANCPLWSVCDSAYYGSGHIMIDTQNNYFLK